MMHDKMKSLKNNSIFVFLLVLVSLTEAVIVNMELGLYFTYI